MSSPERSAGAPDRVDLTRAPIFGWGMLIIGAAFLIYLVCDVATHGLPAIPAGWIFSVPGFALALILLYAGWTFRTDHRYVDASGLSHARHGKSLQSVAFDSLTRISVQRGERDASTLVLEGKSRESGTPTRFSVSAQYPNIGALYRFLSPYVQANPAPLDTDTRKFYNAEAPKYGVDAAP